MASALFRDAQLKGLIEATPCVLTDRQLGPLVDKGPEWRLGAVFTREEAEILISHEQIPFNRKLYYGFGVLAGMRPGEIAALRWRHTPEMEPLGRMTVAHAYNTRKNRAKGTKTNSVRYVPVHPTLAAMLAEWRLSGWVSMMGRQPEPDDLLLPLPPNAAERRRHRTRLRVQEMARRRSPDAGLALSRAVCDQEHFHHARARRWRRRRCHRGPGDSHQNLAPRFRWLRAGPAVGQDMRGSREAQDRAMAARVCYIACYSDPFVIGIIAGIVVEAAGVESANRISPHHSVSDNSDSCASEVIPSDIEWTTVDESDRPAAQRDSDLVEEMLGNALDGWRHGRDQRALRRALLQLLSALLD